MCRLFASQDPQTYEPETRAVRLHGHATSVRLEAAFWELLEEIAADQDMSVARFIAKLHDEVLAGRGEVANLASLLRVSCLLYLRTRDGHASQQHISLAAVA